MSPLGIQIMLHYYCMTNDYNHDGICGSPAHAPAVRDMIRDLMHSEMLTVGQRDTKYAITDRGRAYVDFLCEVPFPIVKWVLP